MIMEKMLMEDTRRQVIKKTLVFLVTAHSEMKPKYWYVYWRRIITRGLEPEVMALLTRILVKIKATFKTHSIDSTTERLTTERLMTERLTTEWLTTEWLTTEQLTTEQLTTEQLTTERLTTERLTTELLMTKRLSDWMTNDQTTNGMRLND